MKKMKLFAGMLLVGVMMSSAAMFAFAEDNGLTTSSHNSLTTASNSDKEMGSTRQLWIFVGNDGQFHARVRGAEAIAKSGNELTARLQWGAVTMDWKLMTDSSTEFIRRNGSASSMNEIAMGDVLSFTGVIDTSSQTRTLHSITVVKDWSLQESDTFSGTVKSVSTNEKSFVLHRGDFRSFWSNPDIKVMITMSTHLTMSDGKAATFADIKAGETVKVAGIVNAGHTMVTAERIVITGPVVITPVSVTVKHMLKGSANLFGKMTGKDTDDNGNDVTIHAASDAALKKNVEAKNETSGNIQAKVAGVVEVK